MKKLLLITALFASSVILALTEIKHVDKQQEKTALQNALKGDRPTVVYVYADWCKFCKKEIVEEAAKKFRNITFVAINNDTIKENKDLSDILSATLKATGHVGNMGLPTYFFVGKGKTIKKSGGMEQAAFNTLVEEFSQGKLKTDEEIHAEWDKLVAESPAPKKDAEKPAATPVEKTVDAGKRPVKTAAPAKKC